LNTTISQLLNHRSIRRYTAQQVSEEQLLQIVQAAQCASSSSNMQAYSVIAVSDPEKKQKLAQLAGNQRQIEECPIFLVWCADLLRMKVASASIEELPVPSTTEYFMAATIDAALAAQNAAVAAESLGLGIVYIGGVRNQPHEVCELLNIPDHVYPVFGMCLGYPDEAPTLRPRLPIQTVLHREQYSTDPYETGIAQYDERMKHYMLNRTGGKKDSTWSMEMASKLRGTGRTHMKDFLQERGFLHD
jgi:FMN reductase (NADPH)